MYPTTVVTHQDKIPEDKWEEVRNLASAATGSSPQRTFLLTNYCHAHPDNNKHTDSTTLSILHSALVTAEKYVKTAKQQQKIKQKDAVREALQGYNEQGGPPEIVQNGK